MVGSLVSEAGSHGLRLHLGEAASRGELSQLAMQVLLERLTGCGDAALLRGVDLVGKIADQHVGRALVVLTHDDVVNGVQARRPR